MEKFLKRWEYQTALTVSWETCVWVKKQQLELDMEPLTGSKLERVYDKAVYYHVTYLTSMQSTASLMAQQVKNPPAMQETWVQSLGWEDPLEKGTTTHSSILA